MKFGKKLMRLSWESLTIFIFSWESHEIVMSTHENFCKGAGLVTRASNGCRTSSLTANSVFGVTALNLPGWHRGREYLREQFSGRCYFSFTSMIFPLNLRVVVLFSLMTPRYMQLVLTPNSVVQESQPIWMLQQNGQTVEACSSAPRKVSTCISGRQQDSR